MFRFIAIVVSVYLSSLSGARAACQVLSSKGSEAPEQNDILYATLMKTSGCPASVQELKQALTTAGLQSRPAMVANRGRHNPKLGSFSFFEIVPSATTARAKSPQADLFFGHFTNAHAGRLELDQAPERGKLMVELIAWDTRKGFYNFYEMIGDGKKGIWFYRGDSQDIVRDNAFLHLTPPGQPPKFGSTLRCSGCHVSGGPIVKEIAAPHNDWWQTQRPLPLAPNRPSAEVVSWLTDVVDASVFAGFVKNGIDRLEASGTYQRFKASRPLRERLRPLFCETEINLESDLTPLESGSPTVRIPSAFFVNPLFAKAPVEIGTGVYGGLIRAFGMRFPETSRVDADHAWLTPVKGYSDQLAIQSLIVSKVIDSEFAADVLAVDMANPVLSAKRCQLLRLIPNEGANWIARFRQVLSQSTDASAQELLQNLENPSRNKDWHQAQARQLILEARQQMASAQGAKLAMEKLIRLRQSVFESEISKNPRGQILEPGFRVIFPEPAVVKRAD